MVDGKVGDRFVGRGKGHPCLGTPSCHNLGVGKESYRRYRVVKFNNNIP